MMLILDNFLNLALEIDINFKDIITNFGNLADSSILILVIAFGLFAGIIKIGKLYKTNIYLLTAITIFCILCIKQVQIINYQNFDDIYLRVAEIAIWIKAFNGILMEATNTNQAVVLNSFFPNDLNFIILSYLAISTLIVISFSAILVFCWLFKKNIKILTGIIMLGLLFIVILNYFFNEFFWDMRYTLLEILYQLILRLDIFLPKVMRIIYMRTWLLFFNGTIPLTGIEVFDELNFYLLCVATTMVLLVGFMTIFAFWTILIIGLFIIHSIYICLLFFVIFVCIYIIIAMM